MCPDCANNEVAPLRLRGLAVQLVDTNGQCYALVEAMKSPAPPWGTPHHDILIPIPAAYDAAELDGFYIALPYTFNGGEHPRAKGNVIDVLQRKWCQVSWHYPDGKPWRRGQDSVETHIIHCQGFFLHRGAVNER